MMYNWQFKGWPQFSYLLEKVQGLAVSFAEELGLVNGLTTALKEDLKQEMLIEILISEALKTSEIEGEYMSRIDVMSSIKRNLGLKDDTKISDRRVAGIAALMTNVRRSYKDDLSVQMILDWHQVLMESFSGVNAGQWRKGEEAMQVVSGAYGREIIHFEAPPSSRVPKEMDDFVQWFNIFELAPADKVSKSLIKSAITHLYFESIHPFEDGNGRIGRALAEYALSHTLQSPVLLSLSTIIERNKNTYYHALKSAQSGLEITGWIEYFSQVILDAQIEARQLVEHTVRKARFFDKFKNKLNERELKVINKMFASGAEGFEGGMTARKYMAITRASKPTATRDLQHLHEMGALIQVGGGRSTRYELAL